MHWMHRSGVSQERLGGNRPDPLVFVENRDQDWLLPCSPAQPVPRSPQGSRGVPLARAAQRAPRYCLSFTAAGLRPDLAAVIAGIHREEGDWIRTKAVVLERNALQVRSASTGKRLESELRQRLERLTPDQLELLAEGSRDERAAMAWLAVLKRIEIARELTEGLLSEKASGLDPVLRRSDLAAFFDECERSHPELLALAPSSRQKVRSALLQMLKDAGLLAGRAGRGGTLGTVQRPLLSSRVEDAVRGDAPDLLRGFLHGAPSQTGQGIQANPPNAAGAIATPKRVRAVLAQPTRKPARRSTGKGNGGTP